MNARWQDTPAAKLLRLLADLMLVNLLALVCSLGIVTIGASLTAMYTVLFRRERDEGTVDVLKTFFGSFAHNFVKATALELVIAALVLVAAGDVWYALNLEQTGRFVFLAVGTVIAVLTLVEFVLSFPQLAAFENTLGNYIKNSLVLAACAPFHLLLAIAAWVGPWLLALCVSEFFLRLGYLYLLWGFAFPAWVTVKLLNKVFQKANKAQTNQAE